MKPTLAAQLGELLVVELGEVGVADVDGAGRQRVEPGEAVHQRALARAGRAHDRRELGLLERHGDAVEGDDLAVAAAVDLDGVDGAGGGLDACGVGAGRTVREAGVVIPSVVAARTTVSRQTLGCRRPT